MNKQEIEKAIAYWKEFKAEIPELKSAYPDAGLDGQEECVDLAISALEHQLTNGWIPVSERLPKQDEEVLVTDITGKVRLMWIVGDRFENLGNSVEIDFIIAWQPLPEPYKEAL